MTEPNEGRCPTPTAASSLLSAPSRAQAEGPIARGSTPSGQTWVWAALIVVAASLQVRAAYQQSLTGDGAVHLVAGYQALHYGENLVNWEHPPLVKLVLAIPASLSREFIQEPLEAKDTYENVRRMHERPKPMLRAMFAGRMFVQVFFVAPGLFACFWLGRRFHSAQCGLLLVLVLLLSFSIFPTFAILQTDGGAFFGFAAVVCLSLRYLDRPTTWRSLGIGLVFGVGLASKYSVFLVAPTLLVAFALAQAPLVRRIGHSLVAFLGCVLVLAGAYGVANRNLSPEANGRVMEQYFANQASLIADEKLREHEAWLTKLAAMSPSAAQFATGFLGVRAQNQIGIYPSYAFGEVSSQGRWWYFPVLALVKLPLALLAALVMLGAAQWRAWKQLPRLDRSVLASAVLVYLLMAVLSNYNIGFRHLLPVMPFVLLPLAMTLAARRRAGLILLTILALESLVVAPLWISSTNSWWLGKYNPSRFWFSGGNLEYSQNFLTLAKALPAGEPIGFLYPGKDTRTLAAFVPGAWSVAPDATSLEPGLYAVSVLVEQYVPAVPRSRPEAVYGYQTLAALSKNVEVVWDLIRQGEDLGYQAGTFHLYRLHEPVQIVTSDR